MKIVCAQSVLAAREAFSTVGQTVVLPDRRIGRDDVLDADALVIRSKTRVTHDLLDGTRLAFVGTATAGFDHIDTLACAEHDVAWTAAPGCNAESVADYATAALLVWSLRRGRPLGGLCIAVIGVGQVGSRVVRRAEALGLRPLLNDPPRALAERDPVFRNLDEILPQADVVTLHVPLTDEGPFATRRMVDCRFLARLKPGALFINASRGEVVDESALHLALDGGQVSDIVLDVWDREPDIDARLLDRALIATPHIAGYSWDGKLAGTAQIYRALCGFFEVEPRWDPASVEPRARPPAAVVHAAGRPDEAVLSDMVRSTYDIEADDRALRGLGAPEGESLPERFERLRKTYPVRREFPAARVEVIGASDRLLRRAAGLGFRVPLP